MRKTYALPDEKKLILTEHIIDQLMSHRQVEKKQKEAGGLLIGRHLLENDFLVVDQITEPTSWDQRLRAWFFRSEKHNHILHSAWKDSDKTQTLLGLWHTHPEPIPTPSKVDYRDWKNTLLNGKYLGNFLVFMIVGTGKIRLWRGNRSGQFFEMDEIQ